MLEMIESRERREQLVQNAWKFVRTNDWEANSSRYLELIRTLLTVSPETMSVQHALGAQPDLSTADRISKRESVS